MLKSLAGWVARRSAKLAGYHPSDPRSASLFGGADSAAGVSVTETNALNYSAVFRAVSLIAESVSTLPLHVYRRNVEGRERDENHPLDWLLNDEPNPEMDAQAFRETLTAHTLTWGNAYAEIERDGGGRVRALWPLLPNRVQPMRLPNDDLVYEYTPTDSRPITLRSENVFHLAGLGFDGIMGYSPIRLARESIGLGLATEAFGSRFFGQSARPGGILTHPGQLTEDQIKRYRESIRDAFSRKNSHSVMVLEEGMGWQALGIPPEDAQFLQTRRFQVEEIARWYGVPPHLLGDLERSSYNNIEQQGLDFLTHSLRPWLRRWEARAKRSLLSAGQKRTHYIEHVTAALVKADLKSRYEAYRIGRDAGFLSANDIRRLENMNPVEGGDAYLQPLNMQDAAGESEETSEPQE